MLGVGRGGGDTGRDGGHQARWHLGPVLEPAAWVGVPGWVLLAPCPPFPVSQVWLTPLPTVWACSAD